MKILRTLADLTTCISSLKKSDKQIGFVPTMGALHEGHLSLLDVCNTKSDVSVVSIYINPTQFNDPQDFINYPKTLDADLAKLKDRKCDIVFVPDPGEIASDYLAKPFALNGLDTVLEGYYRKGHFNGVINIVSLLFELVKPDISFFGEKDYQQLAIIKAMVKALDFPIEIYACPTMREADGLAMSSRNLRLSPYYRNKAAKIYEVLNQAKLLKADLSPSQVKDWVYERINEEKDFKIEYFTIANSLTLQNIHSWETSIQMRALIAVYCDGVRLIDNIEF